MVILGFFSIVFPGRAGRFLDVTSAIILRAFSSAIRLAVWKEFDCDLRWEGAFGLYNRDLESAFSAIFVKLVNADFGARCGGDS